MLELPARSSSGGMKSDEVDRLPPAVRVAFVIVPLRKLLLPLLFEKADGHFQDIGLLQFGAGVVAVELLLQETLELVDAAVDAVSAHLFNNWLPQLKSGAGTLIRTSFKLHAECNFGESFGRRIALKLNIPSFCPCH